MNMTVVAFNQKVDSTERTANTKMCAGVWNVLFGNTASSCGARDCFAVTVYI